MRLVLAAVLALCTLAAPSRATDLIPVKFTLNFAVSADGAPYLLALERGYFRDAGLDVTIDTATGSGEAVTRVASGVYDLGSADFATLVEFAAKQPAVAPKSVLIVYDRAPQAIISLKSSNIRKPADLVGKTVGGGASDGPARLFPAMMAAAGLKPDVVRWRQVTPQLRDSLLLTKQVDAVAGNDYTSVFNLKARGVALDDLSLIEYADAGLDVYSNSIIAGAALLRDHPDVVRRFVGAALRGWEAAVREPAAATRSLVARDKLIDAATEGERLAWIIERKVETPHARAHGIGSVDPARLDSNLRTIAQTFGLPAVPAASSVYDGRFAPAPAGAD